MERMSDMKVAFVGFGGAIWRRAIVGLLISGLLVQVGLGEMSQLRMWAGPGAGGSQVSFAANLERFDSFLEEHVPAGSTMLYVTPGNDVESHWSYIQGNYRLHPTRVWWVTPTVKASTADSWVQSPITAEALRNLAREKGADYIVIDGLDVPEGLTYSAMFQFAPGHYLLRLFYKDSQNAFVA